ncbi:SRA stem-loop-interacting RNA-binding protein, mitochondrial isoform 2 precursor, partial [Daubentonia madagascariensis]
WRPWQRKVSWLCVRVLIGPLLLLEKFLGPLRRDKETGFHKGLGWVQFSTEEQLQNALQQENHIIDGVK